MDSLSNQIMGSERNITFPIHEVDSLISVTIMLLPTFIPSWKLGQDFQKDTDDQMTVPTFEPHWSNEIQGVRFFYLGNQPEIPSKFVGVVLEGYYPHENSPMG
ncbi:hypothetical protein QAD02_001345 [Eretmocerus hayati]|uniref:Uncharacterized protein n=1 Tax=Eretmocerus hayati TaxID=131215 RepID=A0ACC2NG75_9HYME|nr:hypothetical protein QAD02_001345 [Eretmocerus hayati]